MQTLTDNMCIRDQWILEATAQPQHYELHDNITWFSLYRNETHPQYSESAIIEADSDKTYGYVGYEIDKEHFELLRHKGVAVI